VNEKKIGAVFAALGDPTRRHVVECLAEEGALTATELSARVPVTRQAITKHLSTLAEAGLVSSEAEGREVRYHLTPEPMNEAVGWIADTGAEWDSRLKRLRDRFAR
jgi:DNA-binding transcriptional ArsR family regulator